MPTNRYFALRHGRSMANDANLIVSRAENALAEYGITERGRAAVAASARTARALGWMRDAQTKIVSSPFLRTVESAEIVAGLLETGFSTDDRLRERDFGDLELQADSMYSKVWEADSKDSQQRSWGVESLTMVAARTSDLVQELERSTSGIDILFCTHGDTASVLICTMLGEPLSTHRQVASLAPGELVMIDAQAGCIIRHPQNKALEVTRD